MGGGGRLYVLLVVGCLFWLRGAGGGWLMRVGVFWQAGAGIGVLPLWGGRGGVDCADSVVLTGADSVVLTVWC